ncbi:MAG: class I SAM-dependent methyltransferase [Cyclobacteriaceae bacterium]|nr:class I SAM-dependent methyltransferase [Cyclobacteriaceae bacterium]
MGNYARAKVFTRLLNMLPLESMKNILDLGCGYGEFTFMTAEKLTNANFTALDIDTERLEKVEKTIQAFNIKNVKTFEGKIAELPVGKTFDLIFSVDVFEHILEPYMPFNDCYERLNKNGFLIVKMPNIHQYSFLPQSTFKDHNKWLEDEHIGQVLDLKALEKKFLDAGFSIYYKSYSDGFWSRIAWEIGYLSKQGGSFVQLLFLPLCKFFITIDQLLPNPQKGNAIQVIGQKL